MGMFTDVVTGNLGAQVIAASGYVAALTATALAVAQKNGVVKVDLGSTECKVPFAPDYIQKMIDKGQLGKKKKTLKCWSFTRKKPITTRI